MTLKNKPGEYLKILINFFLETCNFCINLMYYDTLFKLLKRITLLTVLYVLQKLI